MVETITYAQVLLRLTRVEVRINDIPVLLKETDGVTNSMRPIREFLVSGKNTAQFIIQPDDIPLLRKDESNAIQEGCAVRMRVTEVEDGVFLDFNAGEELLNLEVHPKIKDTTPITGSGTFETEAKHRWAWTTASPIDPVSDQSAIDEFVAKTVEMFANLDSEGLLEMMRFRTADDVKAYPAIDEAHRKIDFRNALAEEDPKAWNPVPFDPDRAIYRSVADGRMVEVLDTLGLPLVRTATDDPANPAGTPGYFPFPMMIGFIEGELAILR